MHASAADDARTPRRGPMSEGARSAGSQQWIASEGVCSASWCVSKFARADRNGWNRSAAPRKTMGRRSMRHAVRSSSGESPFVMARTKSSEVRWTASMLAGASITRSQLSRVRLASTSLSALVRPRLGGIVDVPRSPTLTRKRVVGSEITQAIQWARRHRLVDAPRSIHRCRPVASLPNSRSCPVATPVATR